jgi:hypothetical protein
MNETRHRRFRFDTRQALLLMVAFAVGMTIASAHVESDNFNPSTWLSGVLSNSHSGWLAVVSVLTVVGLLGEAQAVRRNENTVQIADQDLRFGLRFAVAWRSVLAAILTFCLTSKLLVAREFVALPSGDSFSYEDVATRYLWWLVVGLAVTSTLKRPARPRQYRRIGVAVDAVVLAGSFTWGIYVLRDQWTISYLVHLACAGVDESLINATHRYGIITLAERRLFDAASNAAAFSVLLAAVAWIGAVRLSSDRRGWRWALSVAGGVLLAIAGTLVYWFYYCEFPRLSPDAAEAGIGSNWWLRLGGVLTGFVLTAALAFCGTANREIPTIQALAIPVPRSLHRSLLAGLCLSVPSLIDCARMIWGCLEYGWDGLAYALVYPDIYLTFALSLIGLRLAWRRLRHADSDIIDIRTLSARAFFLAWGAAALWLAVAVPSLAASGCLWWHGTWFLK